MTKDEVQRSIRPFYEAIIAVDLLSTHMVDIAQKFQRQNKMMSFGEERKNNGFGNCRKESDCRRSQYGIGKGVRDVAGP
jgi:hypothetical protein